MNTRTFRHSHLPLHSFRATFQNNSFPISSLGIHTCFHAGGLTPQSHTPPHRAGLRPPASALHSGCTIGATMSLVLAHPVGIDDAWHLFTAHRDALSAMINPVLIFLQSSTHSPVLFPLRPASKTPFTFSGSRIPATTISASPLPAEAMEMVPTWRMRCRKD